MTSKSSISDIPGAWLVHILTASGALFGLLALQASARGAFVIALGWMAVTIAIDGVDGALARWRRVSVHLPYFDGALLDNMVDFFTYVLVPAYFLLYAPVLTEAWRLPVAAAIIFSSAYQFSQTEAKTADHAFTGFPSYWNIAVCYLFLLEWPPVVNAAVLLLCAGAVFIPVRYLYPSRTPHYRAINILLGLLWAAAVLGALAVYPKGHHPLILLSMLYLIYYFAFSLWLTFRRKSATEKEAS
ncbi:MAG TPA: CDP-diacylglycerol O-phosphatidyltransferase [Candidatus Hydrogenedentes bacterium]|jgi:phosphatidylcholine synthase|nr:CDP-diacylglycerol O-phosphatidyltransferase [Candidatus Hydrogenedentota bacterium]HPX86741.1 CDP-diacylglycerol O-phosphatidyltransferase [Candidatus Hydrogenedentota bacterium]